MNKFNTIALLLAAYVVVFLQATFNQLRSVAGVQVDLLPGLVVYAAIGGGITTLTLVAVCGGLWFDSLSANPMGTSMLPLFIIGLFLQRHRDLILREQPYAQMMMGMTASALAPVGSLLLLINTDMKPLLGWFSLWQWAVMSVIGGLMTPVWFWFFDVIGRILNYGPAGEIGFGHEREIKRGRR
jgi:rod shape-determining protein MreD